PRAMTPSTSTAPASAMPPQSSPARASAAPAEPGGPRTSTLAMSMQGSEILRIAGEIRTRIAAGERICNLTVGDFDPKQFPIPAFLEEHIALALHRRETNYPPSTGMPVLRTAVSSWYQHELGVLYSPDEVLITSGSRPAIYGAFITLVDPGDRVVFGVPSWNSNYYCHLSGATPVSVACDAAAAFLPNARQLKDAVRGARLLVLNSPLNPCGTTFDAASLGAICDVVLEENANRTPAERPLYLLYDQVYWQLTFGGITHVHPVGLRPAMRPYTLYVDGMSKAFAATGVRVGWVVGPSDIMQAANNFLGHVGTWAPRAEQIASAELLGRPDIIASYSQEFIAGLQLRLNALYDGISTLKREGFPVDAVAPMGAMYLSARFALHGKKTAAGDVIRTNEDVRRWLLSECGLAVVPFQAFGSTEETGWFRLSVGAASPDDISVALPRMKDALTRVS
ncbi:MAG: pyridoxal phosphate-dependent aminotransferase, partial [Gemmatimonadaceae bacterium]